MEKAGARRTAVSRDAIDRAGRAGAQAALVMVAAQLVWRLAGSSTVPSLSEIVVQAVARLTPIAVFGAVTEGAGGWAKRLLFLAVLAGIVLMGARFGRITRRLTARTGDDVRGRLIASGVVSAAIFVVVGAGLMPVANLGIFGSSSAGAGAILLQLAVTFALFSLVWTVMTAPAGVPVSGRRPAMRQLVTGSAALVAGGAAWKLIAPKQNDPATVAANRATAQQIAASERAGDAAKLTNDLALQEDPFALFTQLEAEGKLTPVITAMDDFYHVSKNVSDPTVKEEGWTLTIDGLVEKELTFTLAELTARATTKKITTLMCISNELNGDLVGTAEWQGVALADLLTEAGVKEGVIDLKLTGADEYEESFPLAAGMDPDTLIVVGMNGATLTDDHGFPARIIVPGIYGMKNVKWLQKIEAIDNDFQGFWQERGWSDPAIPQIWGRVDYPEGADKVPAGTITAAGVAAAGDRDVKRVEVSLDDGETWAGDATLEPAIEAPFTWVRWAYTWDATPGKVRLRIRITDGTDVTAPETQNSPLPDGATGWPKRIFEVTE